MHWTGNFDEVQDFEGQIRNLAGGNGLMSNADFPTGTRSQPLGDRKAGMSADLDALAAYVRSLDTFAPSPHRPAAATHFARGARRQGGVRAAQLRLVPCRHGRSPTAPATALVNVGTIKPAAASAWATRWSASTCQRLRDVWATAPYLHDGSAATLEAAIKAHSGLGIGDGDAGRGWRPT